MRTAILILLAICFIAMPAFATTRTTTGGKLDAPNIIRFTKNLTLGAEASKDIVSNIFRDKTYIEDDKGYAGYIKITWTGSLVDFSK